MLRSLQQRVIGGGGRRWVRRAAWMGGGGLTGAVGGYAVVATTTTPEQRQGFRRQTYFWTNLVPIVAEYYWYFGSKSPRHWLWRDGTAPHQESSSAIQADRQARLAQLHQKHAPAVLQIMLNLKGLYIKLGQVLSVTALPIPNVYREHFRTLQSDVPGYETFAVVQQVLREELQTDDLASIFSYIDPIPCGAASIGQAHYAVLRKDRDDYAGKDQEVIVKIQYPDAAWQVPADIQCVGDLLQLCIWVGVLDETAARISFDDFARQFQAELDYSAEARHLEETYQSSRTPCADGSPNPYQRHGVAIPRVFPDLCTDKVIAMTYLKGPKLEQEARQQLQALGIDMSKGIGKLVKEGNFLETKGGPSQHPISDQSELPQQQLPWQASMAQRMGRWIGIDNALAAFRRTRGAAIWSTAMLARTMHLVSSLLPPSWNEWSDSQLLAYRRYERLALTNEWVEALLDVHGYQIFQQGLFNADCHPGNILVLENDTLGLIDYGQCKRLSLEERNRVALLLLSVAQKESDEQIASAFRNLGILTKNDSTEFLAEMARLMFGRFETYHMDHSFHRKLHALDRIEYFPKELAMVYRTCLLLRGLAVSLQINPSAAEHWSSHATVAVEQYQAAREKSQVESLRRMATRVSWSGSASGRRATSKIS